MNKLQNKKGMVYGNASSNIHIPKISTKGHFQLNIN